MKQDTSAIVQRLVDRVASRQDCLKVAIDRGGGLGRKIENWMLVEMNAELKHLKDEGLLHEVQGECSYGRRKGRADLWWKSSNIEHWMEVKTIMNSGRNLESTYKEITDDLTKLKNNENRGMMHELIIIFPVADIESWQTSIDNRVGVDFVRDLERPHSIGANDQLLAILYTLKK